MSSNTTKQPRELSKKELAEVGARFIELYQTGYLSKREAFLFSFIKGVVAGLGAFFGGTIVVAAVIWLLSLFSELPWLGHLVEIIQRSLHK